MTLWYTFNNGRFVFNGKNRIKNLYNVVIQEYLSEGEGTYTIEENGPEDGVLHLFGKVDGDDIDTRFIKYSYANDYLKVYSDDLKFEKRNE